MTIRVGSSEAIVTGVSKALKIGETKPSTIDGKHLWNRGVNIQFQVEEFGIYSVSGGALEVFTF